VGQSGYVLSVDSSSMTLIQSAKNTIVNGSGVTVLPQSNPVNITTNASGQATVYVRDSVPESATLTFSNSTGTTSFGVPVLFVASTAQQVSLNSKVPTASPDGVTPVTVTALVRDAYGVAVPNAIVDFYTQSGHATILSPTYGAGNANTGTQGNGASPDFLGFAGRASTQGVKGLRALTDATGRFSISIVDTYAESVDVYAALSLNPYANTKPVFSTLTFEQPVKTLSLVSDVSSLSVTTGTATLKATVLDANGGVLPGRVVHFTSTGTGTFNVSNKTTDPYGVATVTLTDGTAETVNVVATIGALSSTQSISFTPIVKTLNVTLQPSNAAIAADGTSVGTILVNVKDTPGVPIAGQVVRFSDPYGSSAQLSAASIITGASGTGQVTIKDPYAESVTIKVTAGGVTKPVVLNFLQTQLSLAISASTPFLADGNAKSVTITAKDANGAALANRVFSVSSTGSMQPSASSVTTNASGNATVALTVRDTVSETASLIFTDATGKISFSQSIQFVAATATQLSLTSTASSVVPDGVATATLNAVVRDSYGVAVSNALIDFYTQAGFSVLSQSRVLTDAQGHAAITVSDVIAETVDIYAALSSNGVAAQSTRVVFEKAINPNWSLSSDVTSLSSDGTSKATLTAMVVEGGFFGTPSSGRTVAFTTTGHATLNVSSKVTNTSGVAIVTLTDSYAETVSVVANINGLTRTQSITFTPVPSSVKIAQVPVVGNVVADGTQAFTLKVKVLDKNNKAITGQLIDVYAQSVKGGFVTVTPTQASSDPVTGILTVTVSDLYATSDTVTLWVSAGTGTALQSNSINLAFVGSAPNQPASIGLRTSASSVLTDGKSSSILTVTVQDSNRAAVTNALVDLYATGGLLSAGQVKTTASGTATVTLTAGANRKNVTATVIATVSGTSLATQIPIQIKGTTLAVSAQKNSLHTASAAVSDILIMTLKDAGGQAIYGQNLNITSNGGGLRFNTTTTDPYTVTTDVNGIATVTVDAFGASTGAKTVMVSFNGNTKATHNYYVGGAAFGITAPTIDPYVMTVVDTYTITVSNVSPATAPITFSTSLGGLGATAAGATISTYTVKAVGGIASAVLKSAVAGIANVQVSLAGSTVQTVSTRFSISQTVPNAAKVTLQSSANAVAVSNGNVQNSAQLTATVRDVYGQPVGQAPVIFTMKNPVGGGENLSPVLAQTDASGVVHSTFTSGSLASGGQGVKIYATLVKTTGMPSVDPYGVTNIIIGGTAGSIVIGLGTKVSTLVGSNSTIYQLPMSLLVSDSNGNPVSGAQVTLNAWPSYYSFGYYSSGSLTLTSKTKTTIRAGCLPVVIPTISGSTTPNEDVNKNLTLDAGENKVNTMGSYLINSTGYQVSFDPYITPTPGPTPAADDHILTPYNAAGGTLPASVVTDANGVAVFQLTYLKSYAKWITTAISATTQVLGTETRGTLEFPLPYLQSDADFCLLSDSPFNNPLWQFP